MMQFAAVTNEVLPETTVGSLQRIFAHAVAEGVTTFEVRTVEGRRFPAIESGAWDRLKAAGIDFGIRYSAMSPGIFKANLRSELIKAHASHLLPMSMDLAEALGIETMMVFAPMRDQDENAEDFARAVDLLGAAADQAARRGFQVQLENIPGSWADTADACLALLTSVNRSNFGYVWDTGNLYEVERIPFHEGLEKLWPFIRNVHLKDGSIVDGRMCWKTFGNGDTDVRGQILALQARGYSGTLVLEAACQPHQVNDFSDSLRYARSCF